MRGSPSPFAGKPAVFLDRDGVINTSPGDHDYVRSARDFAMLPGVPQAIRLLNDAGLPVVVISNQRGIARGLMTEQDLDAITDRMHRELSAAGARVDRVFYCPHDNGQCSCRKPLPGLLYRAVEELGVDLAKSYLVGDTATDMAAGRAAGCSVLLVLTGKTTADAALQVVPKPDGIVTDLAEAVRRILAALG